LRRNSANLVYFLNAVDKLLKAFSFKKMWKNMKIWLKLLVLNIKGQKLQKGQNKFQTERSRQKSRRHIVISEVTDHFIYDYAKKQGIYMKKLQVASLLLIWSNKTDTSRRVR
jgi:hypothetical protein